MTRLAAILVKPISQNNYTFESKRFYILQEKDFNISLSNLVIINHQKTLLIDPFSNCDSIPIKDILYFKILNGFLPKDDYESFFITFTVMKTFITKYQKTQREVDLKWVFQSKENRDLVLEEIHKLFTIKINN